MFFGGPSLFGEGLPNSFELGRQGKGQQLVRARQLVSLFE